MSFILFIILGTVLLIKCCSDKGGQIAASQDVHEKIDWYRSRNDAWKARVVDRALEEDLPHYITNVKSRDAAWEEIYETCSRSPAFNMDLDEMKKLPAISWRTLDVILARRGKVRYLYAELDPVCTLERGDGQLSKKKWDEDFAFWCCICDELLRRGVDTKLIFAEGWGNPHSGHPVVHDVNNLGEFQYKFGRLWWLQATYLDENLNYMF
jgi:hypothetical protein